ncbi:sulfotransferase family protein [Alteromonas sp. ASW11-130]|uniref:sulfotransferase family protein n=1 Tax=Alteromonas sp. ASW11-130 TaxID=3015775 RepID=UPI0022424D9A|nr:sulfotransferase [Alteromonas sp. ASW11-130]MCW8091286.1 sulfotransferase [Alteromonas sp. ASW11-130]
MIDKDFLFLAGHHRSGTSLMHEIIRGHPKVSGFSNTGVPEDEGQHLQDVYAPALAFGGAGKYIFDQNSYMNEHHVLATAHNAKTLYQQWEKFYNSDCHYYIEKSPPNLIRTRFLQTLFPNSKFVIILRHPLAVAYATQKWSKTSIKSLVEHTLRGYEIFFNDLNHLNEVYVLRYEEFIEQPQVELDKIFKFLELEAIPIQHEVRKNINDKYFAMWEANRSSIIKKMQFPVTRAIEKRANLFGYSIKEFRKLLPSEILGTHKRQVG